MFCWALDNPAPANFMLISGDRDFSDALHQLRLRRYNVLLAQPRKASVPLVHAARTVWLWTSLSAGGMPLSKSESLQLIANAPTQECVPSSQPQDSNKFKAKYLPKPPPPAPNNYQQRQQQQNTQGKLIKKPHELFRISEPSSSTTIPAPPILPTTNVNAMSNPQNQYNYAPRPGPYPPRQPYPNPDPSWNNGGSIPNYYPNASRPGSPHMRPPYGNVFRPYRPENLHPPMNNGFRPRNDGPRFMSPPDLSNLSVSQYPSQTQTQNRPNFYPQVRQEFRPKMESSSSSSLSLNSGNKAYLPRSSSAPVTSTTTTTVNTNSTTHGVSPPQPPVVTSGSGSSNGTWGTTQECPQPPSEYVQGLIGVILHALNILKTEKVSPTEPNISDCIQYGDPKHHGTDVKKALESAVEHQMIMVVNMGKLKLYLVKDEPLWNCVNPLGGNPKQYPKAAWDRLHQFLTSSSGRVAIMATQCRSVKKMFTL